MNWLLKKKNEIVILKNKLIVNLDYTNKEIKKYENDAVMLDILQTKKDLIVDALNKSIKALADIEKLL